MTSQQGSNSGQQKQQEQSSGSNRGQQGQGSGKQSGNLASDKQNLRNSDQQSSGGRQQGSKNER